MPANRPDLPEGYSWRSHDKESGPNHLLVHAVADEPGGWQTTLCGSTGCGDPFATVHNRGKTALCPTCVERA